MTGTRTRLVTGLIAAVVVVVVVLAGVWATGAVITNEFRLAMFLTAAWMGVAGLACLAVAVRSRALRWPVLVAYVLTAAVAGAYLGRSQLFDFKVDEQVAVAGTGASMLGSGEFEPVRHGARGTAAALRLDDGGRVLTLTDFDVANGPDLRLYLVAGPARTEAEVDDLVDLGSLKGNVGDQQYRIPRSVDLERYSTVVVWCRAFSVLFARAPL
jgi:hypothetical protein